MAIEFAQITKAGSSGGSSSVEEVNLVEIIDTFLSGNALMEISEDVVNFINRITPNTKLVFKSNDAGFLLQYNYNIINYSDGWFVEFPKLSFTGKFVGTDVLIHCQYRLIEDKYYQAIEVINTSEF